jgi:hypothetical protein
VKYLDSAVKFNTEAVETLSEWVKAIMLDSNKWKDETDIAIHWLNYTLNKQSNTFTYVRQLEFAILDLLTMVKEALISLDSTMTGKLSMNLIPPVMLRNILKNVTSYFFFFFHYVLVYNRTIFICFMSLWIILCLLNITV